MPPFEPTAPALIEHVARHYGDHALAVLGDARLTYADAHARSALMAKALLASGVGKGTRVGLLAPNGPDWIIAWLAVARIGAITRDVLRCAAATGATPLSVADGMQVVFHELGLGGPAMTHAELRRFRRSH